MNTRSLILTAGIRRASPVQGRAGPGAAPGAAVSKLAEAHASPAANRRGCKAMAAPRLARDREGRGLRGPYGRGFGAPPR